MEEIVCDSLGQMNAFAVDSGSTVAGRVGMFLRSVNQAAKNSGQAQKTTAENSGGVKLSVEMSFDGTIDNWLRNGKENGIDFSIGSTGDVLQGLGAIENDIFITSDVVNKILQKHPEIGADGIKKIPKLIDAPAIVMASKTRTGKENTRLVCIGSYNAKNGKPILVILDLMPFEKGFKIADMQKVNSAYTKTETENRTAEENGRLFFENSKYLFVDKKRATAILRNIGFSTPMNLLRDGFMGNISYNSGKVNISGENFSSIFQEKTNYSYVGEFAQAADKSALDQAREMEQKGSTAKDIRAETGWFKGKDGKWRFEISDKDMTVLPAEIPNYIKLGDLISHEQLFKQYPDMKDMQISEKWAGNTTDSLTISPSVPD